MAIHISRFADARGGVRPDDWIEASVQQAPEYLTTRVLQAEFLAVELDDQQMYRKLLDEVLAAPDGDNPDIAPENRAAKRRAKRMLENIADVF